MWDIPNDANDMPDDTNDMKLSKTNPITEENAKEYREYICEGVLAILLNANFIKPDEIKDAKFEFGYFYVKDGNKVTALLKVNINGKTKPFAVQNGKIFGLNMNEEIYNRYINEGLDSFKKNPKIYDYFVYHISYDMVKEPSKSK